MKGPKISVILSVYNGMPFLKYAVESILKQTYSNFEFIIVNDASNDGTLKYLKSLKDKRIKIITNQKNLGLAASLNKALSIAKGEYIARMDADDISLPNRFKTQVEYLRANPEVSLCGCWVDLIDKNGKVIGEKRYPANDLELKNALKWYQPIVHPTFMATKKFYKSLNGYDTQFDYAEDYELLSRAIKNNKFANIPSKLFLWRLANDRRSRRYMRNIDIADYKVKLKILKENYFGKLYILYVFKKFITTFLIPIELKMFIAKKFKLA